MWSATHECEAMKQYVGLGASVRLGYDGDFEQWLLRLSGCTMAVFYCPYCGLKLEPPEPTKADADIEALTRLLGDASKVNRIFIAWLNEQHEQYAKSAPPDKIEVSREELVDWEHRLGEAMSDTAGHGCLATVIGINEVGHKIRKVLNDD